MNKSVVTKGHKKKSRSRVNTSLPSPPGNAERNKLKRSKKDPGERLQFEKLLAVVSTRFINIPIEQLDAEIRDVQQQICEALKLDISTLWQFSPEFPANLFLTHYYVHPDFPVELPENMDASESFPWSLDMMIKKEPVIISRITNAPPAAARDLELWQYYGVKSALTFPLFVGSGAVFGALGFNTLKKERKWPEKMISNLQLVAQIFANALNRKFIEEKLRKSETRLQDLIFSMADWVWEVDAKGVYTYSSSKGEELFGNVIGKTPFDLMPQEEAERVGALFAGLAANKAPIRDLENWNITKDGQRICLLTSGVPILDEAGNLKGYRGVDKDITERKRSVEVLRENKDRLRGVLESTADGILGVDRNGRVIIQNSRFIEMWRIPGELQNDVEDNTLLAHVTDQLADPEAFLAKVSALYDSEAEDMDEIHFKDGRIFERYSRPIMIQGQAMGRVWSFRDITERRRMKELSRSQRILMEAVFDSVPGLLYLYSEHGKLVRWNKQYEHLTGYTQEELYGFAIENWFDEEDRATLEREFSKVFTEGRAQAEMKVTYKNGNKVPYFLTGVKVIIDGAPHLVGIGIDITERRIMEQRLQASEERFREFFQNTPDYCYIISSEGTILDINSAALRMLGYEREELLGKPVSMIYAPDSRAKMNGLFDRWKTSGQIRNEEMVIITRKGEKRIVLLNVGAVRDKDGSVIHSTSVQTDITEFRQIEVARLENMARYQAVVEAFDGFLYICSPDYRVEFMNQRLIERTGRNAVGELCYRALHNSDSVCEWCVNDKIFQGETVRWEVQSPKDHRWYYVVNTPIRHADGTMSKQAMIMDITERKLAEEALYKSEEQILALVENTSDMIWSVDSKTFGLLTFNSALRDYLFWGRGLEISVGMTPDQLLSPEYAAQWREFYSRALREGAFVTEYLTAEKSHVLLLSFNCLKMRGEVFGISVFGRDITERKLSEEALKESESALRSSKKDLQRLAGRLISAQEEELRRLSRELHDDLTQRLAVLAIEAGKLELDLHSMSGNGNENARTVAHIKDQLIKVSEDVHVISRQLHPTILDDLGLVRAIESECSAVMRRHPLVIIFRKEDLPDEIPNDTALCIYRVIQEGLKNITSHSGAENCEISLKCNDNILSLTVSDDGIGFDSLEVRKMPGLGISSMRERVQLIQGEFAVLSEPEGGTVITVRLPLAGGSA